MDAAFLSCLETGGSPGTASFPLQQIVGERPSAGSIDHHVQVVRYENGSEAEPSVILEKMQRSANK